jgi:hypothetical protein
MLIGVVIGWVSLTGIRFQLRGKRGGLGCCVLVELCKSTSTVLTAVGRGMELMMSRYREAIELLYTEPHFHFPVAEKDDVAKFCNALIPHRRHAIETLSIDFRYEERSGVPGGPCDVLGDFRGLKALRIDVRHLWFNSVHDVERRWLLRSLTKVREQAPGLRILELVFDGDEDDVWEEWKSTSERQGVTLLLKELTHMGRLEVSADTLDFMGGYHFR